MIHQIETGLLRWLNFFRKESRRKERRGIKRGANPKKEISRFLPSTETSVLSIIKTNTLPMKSWDLLLTH